MVLAKSAAVLAVSMSDGRDLENQAFGAAESEAKVHESKADVDMSAADGAAGGLPDPSLAAAAQQEEAYPDLDAGQLSSAFNNSFEDLVDYLQRCKRDGNVDVLKHLAKRQKCT